jgi:hypothetical protein
LDKVGENYWIMNNKDWISSNEARLKCKEYVEGMDRNMLDNMVYKV